MVLYEELRDQLKKYIRILANIDYQRRAWTSVDVPTKITSDEPLNIINFLFDEQRLEEDLYGAVGVILKDSEEASDIRPLIEALDTVINTYLLETESEFLDSEEWKLVTIIAEELISKIA
ncbi:MAG: hypothetical protein KF716_30765 [Anaerolineae bacterium]|nr:hypothetical protein [Anaerolineae bacterium]